MNRNQQENRTAPGGRHKRPENVPSQLERQAERERREHSAAQDGTERRTDVEGTHETETDTSPPDDEVRDIHGSLEQAGLPERDEKETRTLATRHVSGQQVPQAAPEGLGAGGKRVKPDQARARDDGPRQNDERGDLPGND